MIPPFFRVNCLDVAGSTNVMAKQAAEAGEAEGLVVQALRQTAGKGQRGRVWDSPEGNLYCSVLLRPQCTPQQACHYSFAAAIAVYDAIAEVHGEESLQFKWPNDVLIDSKKISGILLESSAANAQTGLIDWLIIGVGINVAYHPAWTLYPTTSLAAEGSTASVDAVLDAFLRGLHHWCLTLRRDGFNPVRRAWLVDAKRGLMNIKTPSNEVEGYFGGLDETGGLILRLADGRETVIQTGDVFFL